MPPAASNMTKAGAILDNNGRPVSRSLIKTPSRGQTVRSRFMDEIQNMIWNYRSMGVLRNAGAIREVVMSMGALTAKARYKIYLMQLDN